MLPSAQQWLNAHRLLREEVEGERIVQWCEAGALVGGFSLSLRARPDEVLAPLVDVMFGPNVVRVLDVSTGLPQRMEVALPRGMAKWKLADVRGLIDVLNKEAKKIPDARVGLVLGEWENMLQVWCVTQDQAAELLDWAWCTIENRDSLERWL